ncbi:MAG TPA: ATP-dependent DNA helicase [Oscillatoriaceae cyanobacterium M33_DOE_052]|uniref:ATP-dependent DNA helicase n=1 Tax=Planktothricoides sp. SpSt-374 TaxID=2282167 RepID=A0A7C3ZW19_9CYAN|nr:ATP-dependent DNA helicase [Oscillatoriaceae cyanobacterium M33_DOE_052]
MIEVEVHQKLRAFLRSQGQPNWPHHLTMGRLVARALRLGRGALIQTGGSYHHQLSYLMPLLMWPGPAAIVAPEPVQQRLLLVDIPLLQRWMLSSKPIRQGTSWPAEDFQGILLAPLDAWLADRLCVRQGGDRWEGNGGAIPGFPPGIPTIIEGAEELPERVRELLSIVISSADWHQLMLACPHQTELIRDARVQLTHALFSHPSNPYQCYLLDEAERSILHRLYQSLSEAELPPSWRQFLADGPPPHLQLIWAGVDRARGEFTLYRAPVEVASALKPVWPIQPVVLIGSALDLDPQASIYRQQVGLEDVTCVKFGSDRHNELIQLYLPDRFAMPNTPQFQPALISELRMLLCISAPAPGISVIIVEDLPLKAQVGALLAAEFGSRVQVEKTDLGPEGILVSGWQFWLRHQAVISPPKLLAISTLPIPSLEDPIVAGRVAYYKRQRQDWFRLYLLPTALNILQRSVSTVRQCQGVVALLDSRVIHRSYGNLVLAALSPHARIDYLDATYFCS